MPAGSSTTHRISAPSTIWWVTSPKTAAAARAATLPAFRNPSANGGLDEALSCPYRSRKSDRQRAVLFETVWLGANGAQERLRKMDGGGSSHQLRHFSAWRKARREPSRIPARQRRGVQCHAGAARPSRCRSRRGDRRELLLREV